MTNPSSPNLVRSRLIGGAIPLLIYPGCLLANIMSLAGHESEPPRLVVKIIALGFLWGSTLYPLVYIPSLLIALSLKSKDFTFAAERVALVPLCYLAGLVLLFLACGVAGPH